MKILFFSQTPLSLFLKLGVTLQKSEPTGSFLMLSIHLSFEEIMADLNSANPTSALSFLKHELLPVNKLYKNSNFN